MKCLNVAIVVFASAFVVVAGFGSVALLAQVSPPPTETVQPPGEAPGSSVAVPTEEPQAPSGDVQERAVPMEPGSGEPPTITPRTRPSIPPTTRPTIPPTTGGTSAGPKGDVGGLTPPGPPPSGMAPPTGGYVAPTADLTLIANNLVVFTKSLSVIVKVRGIVTATKPNPVHVRLDFSSPGYAGNLQRSLTYSMSLGFFDFRYFNNEGVVLWLHDIEGNGQPRPVAITITLSDDSGNSFNFGGPRTVTLAPLYSVGTNKLTFKLLANCVDGGITKAPAGLFHLGWWSPAGSWYEPPPFLMHRTDPYGANNPLVPQVNFPGFDFAVSQLSWSALQQMHMPAIGFWYMTPDIAAPWVQPSTVPLPHFTTWIGKDLPNIAKPSPKCVGHVDYSLSVQVMEYRDVP
jgi:hypothetical protein